MAVMVTSKSAREGRSAALPSRVGSHRQFSEVRRDMIGPRWKLSDLLLLVLACGVAFAAYRYFWWPPPGRKCEISSFRLPGHLGDGHPRLFLRPAELATSVSGVRVVRLVQLGLRDVGRFRAVVRLRLTSGSRSLEVGRGFPAHSPHSWHSGSSSGPAEVSGPPNLMPERPRPADPHHSSVTPDHDHAVEVDGHPSVPRDGGGVAPPQRTRQRSASSSSSARRSASSASISSIHRP